MKWILYNNKRYLATELGNGVYHIADEPYNEQHLEPIGTNSSHQQ